LTLAFHRCKIHIGVAGGILMAEDRDRGLFGTPPKSFIVPFILLLLSKVPIHGYELIQKLSAFGFKTLDQGNIYRTLRKLEKENLVRSKWDTSVTGPAKRMYFLTDAGETYLKMYASRLERYQTVLDQFFKMYASMLGLYMPVHSPERKKENPVEQENLTNLKNRRSDEDGSFEGKKSGNERDDILG
jgi:PadR family transcriptional regulator PadR